MLNAQDTSPQGAYGPDRESMLTQECDPIPRRPHEKNTELKDIRGERGAGLGGADQEA